MDRGIPFAQTCRIRSLEETSELNGMYCQVFGRKDDRYAIVTETERQLSVKRENLEIVAPTREVITRLGYSFQGSVMWHNSAKIDYTVIDVITVKRIEIQDFNTQVADVINHMLTLAPNERRPYLAKTGILSMNKVGDQIPTDHKIVAIVDVKTRKGKLHIHACAACCIIGVKMPKCSHCRGAHYCDYECQAAGWAQHKKGCGFVQKKAEILFTLPSAGDRGLASLQTPAASHGRA